MSQNLTFLSIALFIIALIVNVAYTSTLFKDVFVLYKINKLKSIALLLFLLFNLSLVAYCAKLIFVSIVFLKTFL